MDMCNLKSLQFNWFNFLRKTKAINIIGLKDNYRKGQSPKFKLEAKSKIKAIGVLLNESVIYSGDNPNIKINDELLETGKNYNLKIVATSTDNEVSETSATFTYSEN